MDPPCANNVRPDTIKVNRVKPYALLVPLVPPIHNRVNRHAYPVNRVHLLMTLHY